MNIRAGKVILQGQLYWKAYLLGIPTLFIYPLVWMARIAEELKAKALWLLG